GCGEPWRRVERGDEGHRRCQSRPRGCAPTRLRRLAQRCTPGVTAAARAVEDRGRRLRPRVPASIVKLIVEVIEPYHGMILDPACGSGGMFVHSAEFVRRHHKSPLREISIYGVEKMRDTLRLCRMNLAVHGLSGDMREANSYYDDPHKLIGRFDFVMANPPF